MVTQLLRRATAKFRPADRFSFNLQKMFLFFFEEEAASIFTVPGTHIHYIYISIVI